jgi:hypothetical protein
MNDKIKELLEDLRIPVIEHSQYDDEESNLTEYFNALVVELGYPELQV